MERPVRERLRYVKTQRVLLREIGHDERWLQDRLEDDPALLGLGDLTIRHRERKQSSGGRIDFLMEDSESNALYEVEVMLGRLNESHIIRTIEYWDIERRRWPQRDHVAVIVAEEITNRFFNVIALLNRSVPIIALKLDALKVEDNLVLHFTKVLDTYEIPEDEEIPVDPADRAYWERRATHQSMEILDDVISAVTHHHPDVRVTYNKAHIAFGGLRRNFAWLEPRRNHCSTRIRVGEQQLDAPVVRKLEEAGFSVAPRRSDIAAFALSPKDMQENRELVLDALLFGFELANH